MIRRRSDIAARGATILGRSARAAAAALIASAVVLASGCKSPEPSKAATTPSGMIVGPENVAIVKAQQIRSGPAISGTLQPEEQANVRAED